MLDFLFQEKCQIPRSGAFPRPGNLLWVSFIGKTVNAAIANSSGFPTQGNSVQDNDSYNKHSDKEILLEMQRAQQYLIDGFKLNHHDHA